MCEHVKTEKLTWNKREGISTSEKKKDTESHFIQNHFFLLFLLLLFVICRWTKPQTPFFWAFIIFQFKLKK